jgi:small subunit ribosomal protein S4e
LVNGNVVRNGKFPIGVMDIISIPKTNTSYRMVINRRGKLTLVKVQEGKNNWKLSRIEDKTTVTGGKTQLNLHDGTNILIDGGNFKTGDVLKIEVPSRKILETYKLAKGSVALIMSGSHVGETAVIEEYEVTRTSSDNLVWFKDGSYTTKSNVFVIGTKAPEIELPEESAL